MVTSRPVLRRAARAVVLLLGVAAPACTDEEPLGPTEQRLHRVVLSSPGAEGAFVLVVTGHDDVDVTAIHPDHRVFTRRIPGGVRIAVLGVIEAGPLLDVAAAPTAALSAAIEQVAAVDNTLRSDLASYGLAVMPVPDVD